MATLRRLAASYHLWIKLVVCLGLFTGWVEWWFVPNWIAPRYRDVSPMLADHTNGRTMGVLFSLLPARRAPGDLLVVIAGDSSVGGSYPEADYLPWMLRQELVSRYPERHVQLIDLSSIGLLAQDALLLIAKTLALEPDLVVYALNPRIVPTEEAPWATEVGDLAFDPAIVSRVGLGPILQLVEPSALGRTLVYSWWPPARLRVMLGRALLDAAKPVLPPPAKDLLAQLVVQDLPRPPGHATAGGTYLWTRANHQLYPPTRTTRAFDALVDLCRRDGRCLFYHVPTNPAARGGFEPGLLDNFVIWVTQRTAPAHIPFRDFRSFGQPQYFRGNLALLPDAIHMNKAGYEAFAPVLATAVAERLGLPPPAAPARHGT